MFVCVRYFILKYIFVIECILFQILCMEKHSSCVDAQVHVNLPDSREERDGCEGRSIVERGESQEKRTRFSLSHDEGSIGKSQLECIWRGHWFSLL